MSQEKQPKVDITIVLIGLNVEHFLPDCLRSIRSVNWPQERLEKIYVDSGSKDKSIDIVSAESGWQVLHLNDSHPSVAKGRNMGILHAKSPLVQLLDADMLIDPGWLPLGADLMLTDDRLAAVYGRTIERYPSKNIYHGMRNAIWSMHPLGYTTRIPGASMIRAEVVQNMGLHRTNVRGFEDVELALRLSKEGYELLGRAETMCLHDSDINQFNKYWIGNVRGGRGNYDILRYAQGTERWYFWRELRRSVFWPLLLIIATIICLITARPIWLWGALGLFSLALVREIHRGMRTGKTLRNGLYWSLHWMLSKIPYSIGYLEAWWHRV